VDIGRPVNGLRLNTRDLLKCASLSQYDA